MRKYLILLLLINQFYSEKCKTQTRDDFRKIVDTLASPVFDGRGYVNGGVNKAADFIAEQFSNFKLQKFNQTYFQKFTVDVNTFPGAMEISLNDIKLVAGQDFLIDPTSSSLQGKFKTYLINKADLGNQKLVQKAIAKSTGKFLIIDTRDYKDENADVEKRLNETISSLKYSSWEGKTGIIVLTKEKLTWEPANVQQKATVFTVNSDINAKSIKTITVSVEANFLNRYSTSNIVAFSRGTTVPDSFLVVVAHYDHLGRMGSQTYFPGANDNASGVSMLLTMARYYSKNPHKYSMVFIALSAEELGLLGAKYFTEHPLFDLSKIKFLINFDLAGTGDEGIKVVNATIFLKEFARLKSVNDSLGLLTSLQSRGPACNSDHCMFYEKKVPCFYIYTLGGIMAYHDVYDKAETLPLTEIEDYFTLMVNFFASF